MIQRKREVFCIMLSSNKLHAIRAQWQGLREGKYIENRHRRQESEWKQERKPILLGGKPKENKKKSHKTRKNIKRRQTSPFRSCAIEIVPLAAALHQVVQPYKDVLGSEMGRKEMSEKAEQRCQRTRNLKHRWRLKLISKLQPQTRLHWNSVSPGFASPSLLELNSSYLSWSHCASLYRIFERS